MLLPIELNLMRQAVEASLVDTVRLYRDTPVDDGSGGFTESWVQVGEEFNGRLQTASKDPFETIEADGAAAVTVWQLTLKYDQDVKVADRLQINGNFYEITGVLDGQTEITEKLVQLKGLGD